MTDEIREIGPDDFDDNWEDTQPEPLQTPQSQPQQRMESIPMQGMGFVNLRELESNSARLRMVEHTYQTPKDRLPELTYIGRHECANLATMIMFDELASPEHIPGTSFKVWRDAFFSLRRSVGGRHLGKAYQLAEAGMLTEDKNIGGMGIELE